MKKFIVCLCLLMCVIFFVSCHPSSDSHLNLLNYGKDFREKNEVLFLDSACEHALIHNPLNEKEDPSVASIYHRTSCKWGGCDYEVHDEPHAFSFRHDEIPTARAYYKENGYLYHSFRMACEECYEGITLHVLCRTQNAECGAGEGAIHAPAQCFDDCDWQDIFRDTPYRIIVRSDE
jgi:hypothetical protein